MDDKKLSLVDEVIEEIFHKIESRELKEGDKLPSEPKLAKMLHVSRNTIRSALIRLNATGTIRTVHGSGSYVRRTALEDAPVFDAQQKDVQDILQLLVFRKSLEPDSAYLAAENWTPDDIAAIHAALQDMVDNRFNLQEYASADARFHLAIAKASGNEHYYHAVQSILSPLNTSFTEMPLIVGMELNVKDHQELYTAIEQRNASLAQHLMARLIDCTMHMLMYKTNKEKPVSPFPS